MSQQKKYTARLLSAIMAGGRQTVRDAWQM